MAPKAYNFNLSITGDVAVSDGSLPIYDTDGRLVGGFTVLSGDYVTGFLSGQENAVALQISTGMEFYFAPVQGPQGLITHAIVSEWQPDHYTPNQRYKISVEV